jgi:sulfonate transport system ATP-binding protein
MADRILVIDEGRISLDQAVSLPRPRASGVDIAKVEDVILQRILAPSAKQELRA